jgi:Ca2+-binding EF-hand superfamily protein
MLSLQTERQLAQLLSSFADGERAVEVTRQVLSEQLDFSAISLFNHLDSTRLGISASDLSEFLIRMRSYSSFAEAQSVVSSYDANGDGRLNYDEFLQLTLPSTDTYLRDSAQVRRGLVTLEVEHAF